MEELFGALEEPLSSIALRLVGALAVVVVGRWIAMRLVGAFKKMLTHAKTDRTLIGLFGNLLYYGLLAVVIVIALGVLGVPTTSIVAVLGAATLAIGLALQDSISNVAGGVMIALVRPYSLGDYVEVDEVGGFVEDIQLVYTMLTTLDNKSILIPNKNVLDGHVINYSKTELIRLDLVYGISYDDDLLKAKRILTEIVEADTRVAKDPPARVFVKELGDSSVNFVVQPYVHVRDKPQVTFEITEQVKLRFDQARISIPFPQRDVHLFQPS